MEAIELGNTLEPKAYYYSLKQKITLEPKGCCSFIVIQDSYNPRSVYGGF